MFLHGGFKYTPMKKNEDGEIPYIMVGSEDLFEGTGICRE